MSDRFAGRGARLRWLPAVAAAILAAGCGLGDPPDAQNIGICVDPATDLRVPDDQCGDFDDEGYNGHDGGLFFLWMPTSYSGSIPPVGHRPPANVGSHRMPSGTPIAKGAPTTGGSMSSVTRGGLGVKSGSTSDTGSRGGSAGG